jgi:hypothetical protein
LRAENFGQSFCALKHKKKTLKKTYEKKLTHFDKWPKEKFFKGELITK